MENKNDKGVGYCDCGLTHVTCECDDNCDLCGKPINWKSQPKTLCHSAPLERVEDAAAQWFDNNSDCYAGTWEDEEKGKVIIPAMTKEKFLEYRKSSLPLPSPEAGKETVLDMLMEFALLYHSNPQKDIANDAAEYLNDKLASPSQPKPISK